MEFKWEKWIPPRIQSGQAYVPGEQKNTKDWIKLNTNEFPYPPSPEVPKAILAACEDLRYYPNPTGMELQRALARHHSVDLSSIVVFNGCDDALNCCIRGFVDPGEKVAVLNPSYSLYGTLLQNHGAECEMIEYGEDFDLPVQVVLRSDAKMFIFTSPNAPSGKAFTKEAMVEVLDRKEAIFVLDETYGDFSDWTGISLMKEYPNLIIVRSFSKTYGLAGLRIGYAVVSEGALSVMHQIRDVYNTDRLSQAGAVAALNDRTYYADKHCELVETKKDFECFLAETLGWRFYPSSTNFVFCFPQNSKGESNSEIATSLFEFLVENHVLIRYFSNHPLVKSGLRVSIGTPVEMKTVKDYFLKWANKE